MKKRLRKKLHLREFAVHGVSLKVSFVSNLTEDAFGVFVDQFIEEAIESNGLLFGGGGSCAAGWNGGIDPGSGERTISLPLLDAVREWLAARADVLDFQISEPWDIWHGRNPFDLPSRMEGEGGI